MTYGNHATPLVSVCIPTYKRKDLLKIAIESAASQSYPSLEIIVSDDSPDEETADFVASSKFACPISYRRNDPRLGLNGNIDALFANARGEYLVLLHDDDLLLPGAIETLLAPVLTDRRIKLVFGKQVIIDMLGRSKPKETDKINRDFGRNRSGGAIERPIEAALLQQIPNDVFLVDTNVARYLGYRPDHEVGVFPDIDFGIRFAEYCGPESLWFVDDFVGCYRVSDDAISTSVKSREVDHPFAAVALHKIAESLTLPVRSEYARTRLIRNLGTAIVKGYAKQGHRSAALSVFWSTAYGWRQRLSLHGLYQLLFIAYPPVARIVR